MGQAKRNRQNPEYIKRLEKIQRFDYLCRLLTKHTKREIQVLINLRFKERGIADGYKKFERGDTRRKRI